MTTNMNSPFDRIAVVLVEPSHPGNIGAAARAMKNMCLTRLVLVSPKDFPSEEATARAVGASDLLEKAQVVATLDEAIADSVFVVGTSARDRRLNWPVLDPRACGNLLWEEASKQPVALVFGRERTGLTNAELERCHRVVSIPTNPDYRSLNVAAAVQVLCYEVMQASRAGASSPDYAGDAEWATAQQMDAFYGHLQHTLTDLDFLDAQHPTVLMRRLRRLFNRVRLDTNELNILRGVLSATDAVLARQVDADAKGVVIPIPDQTVHESDPKAVQIVRQGPLT